MNQKPFWRGLLRTVLTLALSLFLLSLLVFVIAHYAPGDPLRAYFGDRVEKMSVDERAWAEAKLGLDRPVLTQYGIWLQNALHGDFGISYKYKMDVLEVIRTRLPYTLRLGGVGFVLPTVVGAMIMGIIDNILTLMNVNPHATNIVKGAVILIAVLVDKKVKDLSAKAE